MKDTRILTSKHDREKHLQQLANMLRDQWADMGLFTTCLNCANWNETKEECIKFKIKPPLKVIVVGCEEHSDQISY